MDHLVAMKVFARVAARGSFIRAADDLDLSRSQVSGHIAALEKHLGTRLMNRTTRRVSLTPEGSVYLESCQRVLREIAEAEEQLRHARDKPVGFLRVEVPVAFGRALLIPSLGEFARRYPGIQLDVRLDDRVTDLIAERVDIAVRVGKITHQQLVTRRAVEMRLFLCAAPQYLEAHGVPQNPADLEQHRLIGVSNPQTGRVVEWELRHGNSRRQVRPGQHLVVNSAEAAVTAAAEGLGIIRSVDLLVAPLLASGRLRILLPDWSTSGPTISLVYPAAGHRSAKVRAFADFALSLLERASDRAERYLQEAGSGTI